MNAEARGRRFIGTDSGESKLVETFDDEAEFLTYLRKLNTKPGICYTLFPDLRRAGKLTKQVICIMADNKPDYEENVKRYVANVDAGAVAGIVKYLGIALRSKDSSLVAGSDPVELARVRDNFLKKKLGQAESDAELDAALKAVMTTMKAEREKSRVTVCYLLAEKFGKLDRFKPKA